MQDELTLTFPQNDGQREFRWVFMPYCLRPVGPNQWVVLNRSYKPIGMNTSAHLNYAPFATELHLREASVPHLDWRSREERERQALVWPHPIMLYNDGCIPTSSAADMDAYLKRVSHLMSMTVTGIAV